MLISTHKLFLFVLFISTSKANVSTRYYPRYHLAPPHGWMNDPCGFSYYKDEYHLFYQYNPETSLEPGIAHWGHAKSKDMFNWEHLPIAMYPNKPYDRSGVFTGGALIENNTMYLFYTGNINLPNQTPNHEQHQALAWSNDGKTVTKYEENPIIIAAEYQPNIRDPSVWKHGDTYYMVLGNSFQNSTLGRVLLYASKDLISWEQVSVIDESDGFLGYMWECPNFFEMNGKYVLLFSPQGIEPQDNKYKNRYQTGYIVGNFSYDTLIFTPISKFTVLDHGHDFYATQTILDPLGRRLVVAWCDMWGNVYPERGDGWTGQMTLIRELLITDDNIIIQKPIHEINGIKGDVLYSDQNIYGGKSIELVDQAGEVKIKASNSNDLKIYIESSNDSNKVVITFDHEHGLITLDRGGDDGDGVRSTEWKPKGEMNLKIYIDASSIEMFCGEGEVTFSSRFFPDGKIFVRLDENSKAKEFTIRTMKRTVPLPGYYIGSS